ncbi:MAG: FtsH protease activity modulator HflK [Oscillospiraceae bacterium]|nr:FtsH protease activity modulator HflK [Oscillospiraceae bacterium]
MKKTVRRVLLIIVLVLLVNLVLGSFYNVSEQENAVVTMFGNVIRTDTAGLYFKIPVIQQVHMVDITTHGTGIGYSVGSGGQNITNTFDGIMITKDFNLINIDFYLEYKVSDPVAYLYNSHQPEQILHNIALASIRSTVIDYTVDEAMTTGKSAIQADVKDKMVKELQNQNIGIQVVNITIQDAEPPTQEIILAFKEVETAKQSAETKINQARKYANEQLPAAEAEVDRIIQNAEAQKAVRVAEAQGQVALFNAMYDQYIQNPLITKQRMFYEALESIMPDLKVIITDGSTQTMLPVESFANLPQAAEEG